MQFSNAPRSPNVLSGSSMRSGFPQRFRVFRSNRRIRIPARPKRVSGLPEDLGSTCPRSRLRQAGLSNGRSASVGTCFCGILPSPSARVSVRSVRGVSISAGSKSKRGGRRLVLSLSLFRTREGRFFEAVVFDVGSIAFPKVKPSVACFARAGLFSRSRPMPCRSRFEK